MSAPDGGAVRVTGQDCETNFRRLELSILLGSSSRYGCPTSCVKILLINYYILINPVKCLIVMKYGLDGFK